MGIDLASLSPALRERILAQMLAPKPAPSTRLVLTISGQIRGGKNSVQTTRTGRRYPNAAWSTWRDAAVREVVAQMPSGWQAISEPVNVRLDYVAGDKRRRDMPAVIDAVWHVLEKAGVVTDDTHLWVSQSSRGYDKASPQVTITFP